jgi:hypothetical protein
MPRSSSRRASSAAGALLIVVLTWAMTGPTMGSPRSQDQPSATPQTGPTAAAAGATATGSHRPFRRGSYWNTPLGRAPHDPHSRSYIHDALLGAHSQNYLRLVFGDWGMPIYRSGGADPVYRIEPGQGPTVRVHIQKG